MQDLANWDCEINCTDEEPIFIDYAGGNYRLAHRLCNSHVVDVGFDQTFPQDVFDLDQDSTISENNPELDFRERHVGLHVDIGAYELQGCEGDANEDGVVNVNDLLAVINTWGNCDSCPSTCLGDIDPLPLGDGVVNVNDLLAVINGWGPCPYGFAPPESMPQSIQDCMDYATYRMEYEPHSPEWNEFVNKCIDGLCQAQIINCD